MYMTTSRYEGFGLPPLEAMRLGIPVISSQSASLPEVLGEAAYFVTDDSPSAYANAIYKLCSEPHLRMSLIKKGIAHAQCFGWDEFGRSVIRVYDSYENQYT